MNLLKLIFIFLQLEFFLCVSDRITVCYANKQACITRCDTTCYLLPNANGTYCCNGTSPTVSPTPSPSNCIANRNKMCSFIFQGSTSWNFLANKWVDQINQLPCCNSSNTSCDDCSNCKAIYISTSSSNGYTSSFPSVDINVGLSSRNATLSELNSYCTLPRNDTVSYFVGSTTSCLVKNKYNRFLPNNIDKLSFCTQIVTSFSNTSLPLSGAILLGLLVSEHGTMQRIVDGCSISREQLEASISFVYSNPEQIANAVGALNSFGFQSFGIVPLSTLISSFETLNEILVDGVSCANVNHFTNAPIQFVLNKRNSVQSQSSLGVLSKLLQQFSGNPDALGLTSIDRNWYLRAYPICDVK